jgi:hypothetical protein
MLPTEAKWKPILAINPRISKWKTKFKVKLIVVPDRPRESNKDEGLILT